MNGQTGAGRRGRRPLHICVDSLSAAKSLSLFADFTKCRKQQKRCRVSSSIFAFCDRRTFDILLFPSAPLSRLAPIEALPQTPLGALPPDPHNGFHPLTLTRGVPLDLLLASLGVCYHTLYSFVIPHSSLLTPHSSLLTPHLTPLRSSLNTASLLTYLPHNSKC